MYVLHGIVMKVHRASALVRMQKKDANILPGYYSLLLCLTFNMLGNTMILTVAKVTLTLNQSQGRTEGFDLSANDSSATCK